MSHEHHSEGRIRAILDSAIDAIITVGSQGCIVEFNQAAERVFGLNREKAIGASAVEALVPPRYQEDVQRELERYIETGESPIVGTYVELPGLRADGSEFPAELAVTVTSTEEGERLATIFVRDITDRVEAEKRLQRQLDEREAVYALSEATSRAASIADVAEVALDTLARLLGTERAAVLLLDESGTMRFAAWRRLSEQYRALAEGHSPWPPDEIAAQPVLVPDVLQDASLAPLGQDIVAEGIRSLAFIPLTYESRLLGKFMIYCDAVHEFSADEVRLAQTIANHVAFAIGSQRRRQAVEEQRSFLSQVLEINPNLTFAKDREGRFTLANPAVAELYGTSVEYLLGQTDADFNPNREEVEHFRKVDLEVMDTLREHVCEEAVTDYRGRVHWLYTVKRPIIGQDGKATHVLGVAVDITERKGTEEELTRHREHLQELVAERTRELERSHQQLRQSERLAMIGTLSTGLGHDMGNLLLPLRVRLDSMEAKGLPAEFHEDTRAIRIFTEYLQRLSNGLRLLALDPNEPGYGRDTTDLHEWWPDVEPVLKNALPSRIMLDSRFDEKLPRVCIARHVLTQVVFNLVQNAGEAMREQAFGRVSISAHADPAGHVVHVDVSDTGPGMSAEVASRCMEPFFTTKTRAISTGLGLALVHGMVQQSGARIELKTEVGHGSTFTLDLPVAHADRVSRDRQSGSLNALVSLQDVRSRSHITSVLRSLGFGVEHGDRPTNAAIDVWVADSDSKTLRLAREFASAGERKHAILLGTVPHGPDFSRIIELPRQPKPSEIWRVARGIAERFELERKDSGT